MRKKAISLLSGGMDSATLAYLLHDEGYNLHLLSFDYGQRHRRELRAAESIAACLGALHHIIDLTSLTPFLKRSALTDNISVPHGHYTDESMRVTVVPNRNALLLSIAYAVAVSEQAEVVGIGAHAGDHPIYPDCRPEFMVAFSGMEAIGTKGHAHHALRLYAPFILIEKRDIVVLGNKLGVPYEQTWSCYEGQALHCGECGTCVERKEAFALAGVADPTEYAHVHNQ